MTDASGTPACWIALPSEVEYLGLEDLLEVARDLSVSEVRDLGLLDSAVHRPATSLFGRDAYSSIHDKAAVLLESLVRNHGLVDGNKRLGWMATFVFYGLNDFDLAAPEDDAYDLVIGVATGDVPYREAAQRLAAWARPA